MKVVPLPRGEAAVAMRPEAERDLDAAFRKRTRPARSRPASSATRGGRASMSAASRARRASRWSARCASSRG